MNKEEMTVAYTKAHKLIDTAKTWVEHNEKNRNDELIVVVDILNNGTVSRGYRPATPWAYESIIKDQISALHGEERDYVFGEVSRVLGRANEEMSVCIDTRDGVSLRKIIDACHAIQRFRTDLEKEEELSC